MKKIVVFTLLCLSSATFLPALAQKTYLNYRRTVDSLDRQLFLLEKTNVKDSTKANVYLALAKTHANRDNGFAAIYAQKALVFSQEIDYQKGVAEALLYIGLLDKEQLVGLEKAIENLKKSLKIYHELGHKKKMVELHRVIGSFYYKIAFENPSDEKNFKEALSHYQASLKIHISLGDSLEMAADYEMIGELYSYLKDDEKALDALKDAEKILTALGKYHINNARLLAKYKRIEELKDEVQQADMTRIVAIFSIIITILVALLVINFVKKREAYKKLREHNIDISSIHQESVAVETEIGHKAKIKF